MTSFVDAVAEFGEPRGYLAVASIGLPPRSAVEALTADLAAWARADRDPQGYDATIARTRESYARLVGVPASRVAIGSQTSVLVSMIVATAPQGAEIVLVDGDFSSVMFPFLARTDLDVRIVPLTALAQSLTDRTWLVAFSRVQSATGQLADIDAVLEAAKRTGTLTLLDTTQAAGILPVDASPFDVTVCHSYKWLCAPRGVAFLTVTDQMLEAIAPRQAGWYAGDEVWKSAYGPTMHLATDARRLDVSPAWQAWIGAECSIGLFASLDIGELWDHAAGLGDALCSELGIPEQHQAIITWPDASGQDAQRLNSAGIRVSSRAGRLRASFHLWNTAADVEAVIAALR